MSDREELMAWVAERFEEGCWLGDTARLDPGMLDDDDEHALAMAREAWITAGGW